jgi:hypothetical protein
LRAEKGGVTGDFMVKVELEIGQRLRLQAQEFRLLSAAWRGLNLYHTPLRGTVENSQVWSFTAK